MSLLRSLGSGALALLLLASAARAGVVMQFEHREADGQPPVIGTAWINPDRVAMVIDEQTMIYRADEQVLRTWSEGSKTYQEITKETAAGISDAMKQMQDMLQSMPPEQRAMVEQMMKQRGAPAMSAAPAAPAGPAEIVATGKTQTLRGWACSSYEERRDGRSESELWVTDWAGFGLVPSDFTVFKSLAEFVKTMAGPMAKQMESAYARSWEDERLPGVPVRIVTLPDKSVHDITKLERQDIPASRFEVPAGMTPDDSMAQALGRGLR